MLSNVDIRQSLLVLIELNGDIIFGDLPVIVVAVVGDTETQLLEYRNTQYVISSFFFQPTDSGTVLLLQARRRCTGI